MCRRSLGKADGLVADQDDAGQHFSFAICTSCAMRYQRWSPAIRKQQIRAAIGLLAMNPERYEVRLHDSKAAAWLYVELEVAAIRQEMREARKSSAQTA